MDLQSDNGLKWKWSLPLKNKTFCIFVLLFKLSWYEITKKVRVLTKGASRTSAGNKKIDASRNRLFRVAIMSCACLLMNTAATVFMSVVLEDWSVSSDQWLTCTVAETFFTRNWANYGLHVGDRYFLFGSWRRDTCWLLFCFDCWLLHLLYQRSRVWTGGWRVRGSSIPKKRIVEKSLLAGEGRRFYSYLSMVRFSFYSKTNIAKLKNVLVLFA